MESPNTIYNIVKNNSKDTFPVSTSNTTTTNNASNTNNSMTNGITQDTDNIIIPSNFLISTKEIIAKFPHNKRVGHYLLGRKLGEGSFAKVKEGLHTLTGQKVAIKVIDKKKAKEDAYVSKNMRREGKLLQMVLHPNIIQLYELMETENSYYLVAELCEGGDLMDYICNRKFLSETCTRKFIRQIISAVDYLHRIGILHRDLKIENLLLDKNHNIKLIDFGLSNHTKNELCITQCGSPAYAAPELLAHKKYGPKVDVWSIGVNMYAMLTGNLPFTVEPFNIKALYNKMMKNEMNSIPEHLSKSGEDLLRRLLNPDPIKRISLREAMEHTWTNEGYQHSLKPHIYPNKPTDDMINPTILKYMSTNMSFNVNDIADNIKANKASSSLATYYLLLNKVKTMISKMDPKKDKLTKSKIEAKPIANSITTNNKQQAQDAKLNESHSNKNLYNQQVLNKFTQQQQQQDRVLSIDVNNHSSFLPKTVKIEKTAPLPHRNTSAQTSNKDSTNHQTTNGLNSDNSLVNNLTEKYKTLQLYSTNYDSSTISEPKTTLTTAAYRATNSDSVENSLIEKSNNSSTLNNSSKNASEWTQLIKLPSNGQIKTANLNKNGSGLHLPPKAASPITTIDLQTSTSITTNGGKSIFYNGTSNSNNNSTTTNNQRRSIQANQHQQSIPHNNNNRNSFTTILPAIDNVDSFKQ